MIQGRNALLRLALSREVGPGYSYFIFSDEDAVLEPDPSPLAAWKPALPADPWLRLEQFLVAHRPMLAAGIYNFWQQSGSARRGPASVTSTTDQCLQAYSR